MLTITRERMQADPGVSSSQSLKPPSSLPEILQSLSLILLPLTIKHASEEREERCWSHGGTRYSDELFVDNGHGLQTDQSRLFPGHSTRNDLGLPDSAESAVLGAW